MSNVGYKLLLRYWKVGATVLLGIGIWMFWAVYYPFALTYQEQYQLFLFTSDYLTQRLGIVGGVADYVADFIGQFYYMPWLGAILLGLLSMALLWLVYAQCRRSAWTFLMAAVVPILMVRLMGDESVLLTYYVAMLIVLSCSSMKYKLTDKSNASTYYNIYTVLALAVTTALLYWIAGPMCWLYVLLVVARRGWRWVWLPVWLLVVESLCYATVMQQWPPEAVFFIMGYYRNPMMWNSLMAVVPLIVVVLALLSRVKTVDKVLTCVALVAVALAVWSVPAGFDDDKYELIHQDQLIRAERWDRVIERAEVKTVATPFWSNSVNLALAEKRLLAERMFDFYQSGEDALIMPPYRDLTSNLPTAEAFYRLGLVNSAMRYMFDIQESIMNFKKSGRCTKRIIECMLINGQYKPAQKQIDILKHSLFYRDFALDAERCLGNEAMIDGHPVWGRLRKLRFKDDFLYSSSEIDKIFGLLFMNNKDNKMALDYFMAQNMLKVNIEAFMQYMSWVQQYGGYRYMPTGYQDAVQCIQSRGQSGGKYARYVEQKVKK